MKFRGIQIYSLFALLIISYAGWNYWESEQQSELAERDSKIISIKKDDINSIRIERENEVIELQRHSEGWKMLQPIDDIASTQSVENFLESLETEKATTKIREENIDLGKIGLQKPKMKLVLQSKNHIVETVEVGSIPNFEGESYLHVTKPQTLSDKENISIVVGSAEWQKRAGSSSQEFRDRRLMRESGANVSRIEIQMPKEKIQFQKTSDRWKMIGQDKWLIDQNKVREILNKLNVTEAIEISALGFPENKEELDWGFRDARKSLSIRLLGDKEEILWTGRFAESKENIARCLSSNPHRILKINPSDLGYFFQLEARQFRDAHDAFDFEKGLVREVILTNKDGNQKNLPWDSDRARYLMKELRSFEVSRFGDEIKASTQARNLKNSIQLLDENKSPLLVISWGEVESIQEGQGFRRAILMKSSRWEEPFQILESDIEMLKWSEDFPIK